MLRFDDINPVIKNIFDRNLSFIKNNLNNENLHKLFYIKIQNDLPREIINTLNIKELMYVNNYQFKFKLEDYDYSDNVLQYINNLIFTVKQDDLQYLETKFSLLMENENVTINESLIKNAVTVINDYIDDFHHVAINNNFTNLSQLNNYVKENKEQFLSYGKEIIGILMPKNICKKYNYSFQESRLFASYLLKTIDISQIIIFALEKVNQNRLFSRFVGDPWQFINFKDNTKDKNIVYSTRSPSSFSSDRTSPLIIIDNQVLQSKNIDPEVHHNDLLRKYKQDHHIDDDSEAAYTRGYNNFNTIGVGSSFNKVVLLEFIRGNMETIKQALWEKGYKKIYVNNNAAWTSKEYKRVAKTNTKKKHLMKKLSAKDLAEISDLQTSNNALLSKLDNYKDELVSSALHYINRNITALINNNLHIFKEIIIKYKFYRYEQLKNFLLTHDKELNEIIKILFIWSFIKTSNIKKMCKKLKLEPDSRTITHWLINNIDRNHLINIMFNTLNNVKDKLFYKFIDTPENFTKFKDDVNDKVYSIVPIEKIPSIYNDFVIVNKDGEVKRTNSLHEAGNKLAFGSVINNTVLLYGIKKQDYERIKNILIQKGFKKVYACQYTHWTWDEYLRIANKKDIQ